MNSESLKQLQLTLLNQGTHKLIVFQNYITSKAETDNLAYLSNQLDFVTDCSNYQKFTKKYYTERVPGPAATADTIAKPLTTSEILKNCSSIPFMKRPAKVSLERYNSDLEITKTMLLSLVDNYLTKDGPKYIPLDMSILEPLVKLIDKGYAHPDIFSEAHTTTMDIILPYYQEFTGIKQPKRSSLLSYFSEKSLIEIEHFTSMFTLSSGSDGKTVGARRSSMVSSNSSSLSKQSADDLDQYQYQSQDIPKNQSRKNSRFDASLPVLSELCKVEEKYI